MCARAHWPRWCLEPPISESHTFVLSPVSCSQLRPLRFLLPRTRVPGVDHAVSERAHRIRNTIPFWRIINLIQFIDNPHATPNIYRFAFVLRCTLDDYCKRNLYQGLITGVYITFYLHTHAADRTTTCKAVITFTGNPFCISVRRIS